MIDIKTDLKELMVIAKKFRDDRDWKQFHTPKDMAIDVAVEAGELLEHFRFRTNEEIKEFLNDTQAKKEMSHEMADCLFGLLLLADECDIDLAEAFSEKMEITGKRYPVEKSKGVNKKYTQL